MKIFYSNMASVKGLEQFLDFKVDVLVSYHGISSLPEHEYIGDIFLDSGAFSAYKKNQKEQEKAKKEGREPEDFSIDLENYIQFIKEHEEKIFCYAGLDVIGDPAASYRNQQRMDKAGLSAIPTYHFGADEEQDRWLVRYLEEYDYIALGGLAFLGSNQSQIKFFLDRVWRLINKLDNPPKIHGFGIQSEGLMRRYPWYSIDATSAHVIARYGGIYTPWGSYKINPEVNADDLKWKSPKQEQKVREWVNSLNLPFGFDDAAENTAEATLKRCAINILYFKNFVENMEPIQTESNQKSLI